MPDPINENARDRALREDREEQERQRKIRDSVADRNVFTRPAQEVNRALDDVLRFLGIPTTSPTDKEKAK